MRMTGDKLFDDYLSVDTGMDHDETINGREIFFGYEPTSYQFLESLFNQFPFKESDGLVDFGCGNGRVLFMAAMYSCKNITGYEFSGERFAALADNLERFNKKHGGPSSIRIVHGDAQDAVIEDTANKFFFFNPFHLKVYMKVIRNIEKSLKNRPRDITIFLYEPHESTLRYLDMIGWLEKKVSKSSSVFAYNKYDNESFMDFSVYSNYPIDFSVETYKLGF